MLVSIVAFVRGQQGDMPVICPRFALIQMRFFLTAELGCGVFSWAQEHLRCTNGSKPRGHQAAAVSSSEPDTTTCASIPSSSVSREPTHDTPPEYC